MANRATIVGGQAYAPQSLFQENILIRNSEIQQITTKPPLEEAEIINARDLIVAPGLIDALVHSEEGYHTMTGDPYHITDITRAHHLYWQLPLQPLRR